MRRTFPLALALSLSCTVGPDYERPRVDMPAAWQDGKSEPASLADLEWWKLFGDPVLNELVGSALQANFDTRLALERVAEVRARLGFVKADLYPRLDAFAAAGVVRASRRETPLTGLIEHPDYQRREFLLGVPSYTTTNDIFLMPR